MTQYDVSGTVIATATVPETPPRLSPVLNPDLLALKQSYLDAADAVQNASDEVVLMEAMTAGHGALRDYAMAIEQELAREQARASTLEELRTSVLERTNQLRAYAEDTAKIISAVLYETAYVAFSNAAAESFLAGKFVQTIKLVRDDNPGMALSAAKAYVDHLKEVSGV